MIIQNKDGEWKEYQAHELPDGCIVTQKQDCVPFRIVNIVTKNTMAISKTHGCYNTKIHDIVDDNGISTHVKRWMAMGGNEDVWSGLYYGKPIRCLNQKVWHGELSGSTCGGRGSNNCGQTWEDEPIEVWEYIK